MSLNDSIVELGKLGLLVLAGHQLLCPPLHDQYVAAQHYPRHHLAPDLKIQVSLQVLWEDALVSVLTLSFCGAHGASL